MLIKNLEKLRKRTLRERIYEEVVRLILAGELPSGGWVDEKRVIERLRVSRTPFREAIGILANWSRSSPIATFYVRSFFRNEAADLEPRCLFGNSKTRIRGAAADARCPLTAPSAI
jgi:DNA-binding GntR family transcriptional regulator